MKKGIILVGVFVACGVFLFIFQRWSDNNIAEKRKIALDKTEKSKAVEYICGFAKRENAYFDGDPYLIGEIPFSFFCLVGRRYIVGFDISKQDLADCIKRNPPLVQSWLDYCADKRGGFDCGIHLNDEGYYQVECTRAGININKKSKEPYMACAEFIIGEYMLGNENSVKREIRNYFIDQENRDKFLRIYKKAGYDYVFGDKKIQEKLFGEVIE